MRLNVSLALLTLVVCVGGGPLAQTTATPSKSKPANAGSAGYASGPFDTSLQKLPAAFKGNDCVKIAARARVIAPPKGKFESSAEFTDRMEAARSQSLLAGMSASDTIAFVPQNSFPQLKYDADKGVAKFEHYTQLASFRPNPKYPTDKVTVRQFPLILKHVERKKTLRSNAFGATVRVEETKVDGCGLVANNLTAKGGSFFSNEVPLSSSEARELDGNVGVLYVGKLMPPYVDDLSSFKEATAESPTEIWWTGDALMFELAEIWYYDKRTGAVAAKVSLPPLKS